MTADFFRSQMDYIFFYYGLTFILLAAVCHFLSRRAQQRLPWVWLGFFGVAHGLNEWLDLLALDLGSGPVFDLVRLGLLAMSFAFLVEFGRAGTLTLRGRGSGRWILAALLGVSLLGSFAGLAGLAAATRYALGLVGGLWAAGALYLASRDPGPGKLALLLAALGIGTYALAAGLVVNFAPFFPASLLNATVFFTATGLPIQLVRGLLALWIIACLNLFAQASLAAESDRRIRVWVKTLMVGGGAVVIVLLIIGWFTTQYFGENALKDVRTHQETSANDIYGIMMHHMDSTEQLVSTVAKSPEILPALEKRDLQAMEQTNVLLDRTSYLVPGSVCYLMDLTGLTIASSNRHQPDSFVGKSYEFRPYFQQAVKGSPGRYWALGVTSKEMGFYASIPVRDRSKQIVGVMLFKRPIGAEEKFFPEQSLGFVVDSHGVVVMANRPGMVLKSLWPLSSAIREELSASRQFGPGPFTPILAQEPVDSGESLFQGKRQLVMRQPFPWEDWSIVILSPMHPIVLGRLIGITVTLLSCFVVIGLITIIGLTVETTDSIQISEKRLKKSNVKLETMVVEANQRTQEIGLINQMSELLQACPSIHETYCIITRFAPELFPALSGSFLMLDRDKNLLEAISMWGSPLGSASVFAPEDCLALQLGRVHLVEGGGQGMRCRHLHEAASPNYLCLPLIAHGETLGLLHFEGLRELIPGEIDWLQRRAETVTDHVALALTNIRLRETLQHQAIHDPLTALFNRRYLDETMVREIHRVQRKGAPLGVIMLDLDHFKRFNDTYGHEAGDNLLLSLGELLLNQVRQEDVACRYGGEEFVLIMPEASLDVVKARAEEIREQVAQLQVLHRGHLIKSITASLGVAMFSDHAATWEDVLRAADDAMYQAKREGRNRVVVAKGGV